VTVQEGLAIATAVDAPRAPRGPRPRFTLGSWLLPVYTALALVFLLIPIAYTFIFSFNDAIKSNISWRGFTLNNWINVCNAQDVCSAFGNSILIGVTATVIATTLGTMIAIALVRYRFRFRSGISLLLFLPMATPEVVLGAGLAAEFLGAGVEKGLVTIIIAHTMFCISFVVVTVKARVSSLDPALEEAGRDLYGSPAQVFWRITFLITNFNSGTTTTFPKFVYIAASRGIPPEANVIASAVFLIAIVLVVSQQVSAAARRKRLARIG
jgi:spermidine/putrescine transport system permease protein